LLLASWLLAVFRGRLSSGRLEDLGLYTLRAELSGKIAEIGSQRTAQLLIAGVHRDGDGAGPVNNSNRCGGLAVAEIQENLVIGAGPENCRARWL
jgi:hypothetical protein